MGNQDNNADLTGTVRVPKEYADRTRRVLEELNKGTRARLVGPTKASKLIALAVKQGMPVVLAHMEEELGLSAPHAQRTPVAGEGEGATVDAEDELVGDGFDDDPLFPASSL